MTIFLKKYFRFCLCTGVFLYIFVGLELSQATTITTFAWDGGGANTNWADANNWTNSTAPSSSANNRIVMLGTLQLTNTTAARTVHSLIFSNDAGAFVIYGGTITIDNADGIIQMSANAQTITNAVTIANDQTWTVHSNSLILSTGLLDLGSKNLTINNNTNVFLNGVITGGSGTRAITKNSNGFLYLSAINTFDQDVTVNDGVLLISANDALGTTAGTSSIGSGGTLGLSNNLSYTTAEVIDINGVGENSLGAIHNFHGNNSFGANVTLAGDSLIRLSAGSLLLGGTVDLGGNQLTLSNLTSTVIQMTNVISGSGGKIVLHQGDLHLSRINTFTGAVTNKSGNIFVSSSNALGSAGGATVIESGATLSFTNNVNYGTVEGVGISGNGILGEGAIQNVHGTNRFGGPITLNGDSTIKVQTGILYLQGAITNGGFKINADVTSGNNLSFSNVISGTGGLDVRKGGTVSLFASNTFSGQIVITNSSTLELLSHRAVMTNNIIFTQGTLTLGVDGLTNVFGNLTMTSNSTINLNAGAGIGSLTFTNATYEGGTLTINNWTGTEGESGTNDRIYFSNDPGAFVNNVTFTGFGVGSTWLSGTGELVPAPEPGTIASALISLALVGAYCWRVRMKN